MMSSCTELHKANRVFYATVIWTAFIRLETRRKKSHKMQIPQDSESAHAGVIKESL